MKTELWYVSVGGNDCEPARVVIEGAVSTIYTIGCADGTVYEPGCGMALVELIEKDSVPLTPEKSAAAARAWDRKVKRDHARGIHHGYRRFDT